MVGRLQIEDRWPLLLAPAVPILTLALAMGGASGREVAIAGLIGVFAIVVLCLTAYVDIAWLFGIAIALSIFSGNWRQLGVPNLLSPDRIMLIVALVTFLVRDPSIGRRPFVRMTPTHVVLLVAVAFAICSAVAAGTIGERPAIYTLVDRFGIGPFLIFVCAPVVFATAHQRRILLGILLAVGAYLGLTAFFEGVGPHALVFPKYILDPGYGFQPGRARGPFAESAVNGVALFYSAVAAAVAFATMRRRWVRYLAAAIAALCAFDLIFTLQRSVWIGAGVATLVTCLAVPALRRYVVAVVAVGAVAVVSAFFLVPGLQDRVDQRVNDQRTTWDRKNLNRAAENMIEARPLSGFGWGTFQARSGPYFEQSSDYPLTNTSGEVHNVFLSNAVELGLPGTALWLLGLAMAVGGAIFVRGPPELYPWRIGLLAIAVMWLIVANLIPMVQAFPNEILWLWAGVAWPWRYAPAAAPSPAPLAPLPA